MKQSMIDILNDDEKLKQYIQSLEDEIDESETKDNKIDIIIDNIMNLCDDFKDRRALKPKLIETITELIRLKTELPLKRTQTKKTILDIMVKKDELEIKKMSAKAQSTIAGNSSELLVGIYNMLDNLQIHPYVPEFAVLETECKDIIDSSGEETIQIEEKQPDEIPIENNNIDIEENKNSINILDIQAQLEEIDKNNE